MKRVYAVVMVALACLHTPPATAQTIPIRTVPVASGDQFLMLPSATMGMGGVHLALDDSLGDAWANPAKGVLIGESAFLGSPTFYSISRQGGAGRTFPVAGLFAGPDWFGGGALALQQIENEDTDRGFFVAAPRIDICCFACCGPVGTTLSERLGTNVYANAFLGRRLGPEWSIGLAASGGRLGMMDGVDLLYANAERIEQSGSVSDVRVGLYRSGVRDRFSLLLLHNRVSMTHEVTTANWVFEPPTLWGRSQRLVEVNEDHTRTFGGHLAWDRSLRAPGWRVGAAATINYKDHPKIPNYSIQNIPRDPGTTWAYEAAVGFARTDERTKFALDFALQPIWSETWQEADAADVEASGRRLRVGDRSIDNDFFFTNVVVRSGLSHDVRGVDLQVGLQIRSYAYQLEQVDHVQSTYREQDESWIEWSPTFGVLFRVEALDVRYSGRITTGTGRPGVIPDRAFAAPDALVGDADFILAPEGPLTLRDARVTTHQLSVRIPIR
jgi:hypothetical protein